MRLYLHNCTAVLILIFQCVRASRFGREGQAHSRRQESDSDADSVPVPLGVMVTVTRPSSASANSSSGGTRGTGDVEVDDDSSDGINNEQSMTSTFATCEPEPPAKFMRLTKKLDEEENQQGDRQPSVLSKAETEMAQYVSLMKIKSRNMGQSISIPAVEFWKSNTAMFPMLAPVALDLCVAPASEAFCERIFSVCGDFCARKRNRTSKSLEKRVFLKLNARLFSVAAAASTTTTATAMITQQQQAQMNT